MRSEVGDRPDRDHRPRLRCLPAGDTSHDAVAPRNHDQQLAGALRDPCVGGVLNDRRERAVDVEQYRRAIRVRADGG